MKWKDVSPREYYSKYERMAVKNDCGGWFEVYRLPHDVYAICEPQHFQEVNMFLVIGEKQALLLDTGMGFCPLEPLIHELFGGDIIAVNSHFHFDHIGNNYCFEPVHIFDDPDSKRAAENGLPKEALGNQLEEEMFRNGYPIGFDPCGFRIPPYRYIPLHGGERFDLGGRSLRVIHTPGHSGDCIMLYDEEQQILFTGDTFYLGALYAHFDCDEFGHSDAQRYLKSMETLISIIPETALLYCSHNDFIAPRRKLDETAEALRDILSPEKKHSRTVDAGHQYLEGEKTLKEFVYDGFSIVCSC